MMPAGNMEGSQVIGVYIALGDAFADLELITIRRHVDGRITAACGCDDGTLLFAKLMDGTDHSMQVVHSLADIVRERRLEQTG